MAPKVCILAGGLGTRLSEETVIKPKPMVEIGGRPILWHIMKLYSSFGLNEFAIALGYKGEVIKDYFVNFTKRSSNLTIDLTTGGIAVSDTRCEPWRISLLDTGLNTHTGGRVRMLCEHVGEGLLMLTYGDGVADVDINKLLDFHRAHGKLATITAVHPPARFGALQFSGDRISNFSEKPLESDGWINGGFFILDAKISSFITDDNAAFEREPLERLASEGQLMGYRHNGFWQCMDTLRDVKYLDDLWNSGKAPWKRWNGDKS